MKVYRKTDTYKVAQTAYRQTPNRKKYIKSYQRTPTYKSYRRTIEIKKYQRVYHASYNRSARGKAVVSKWTKLRKATDPTYKMICCLRVRIYNALKGGSKSGHTLALLGCTIEHARAHLENQLKPGWCWANHGKVWHIDHVRPLASFKVMDETEQRVAFHYTNLQPLLGVENIKKGSLYNGVRHTRKRIWTIDDF